PIVVERSTYFAGGRGGHNVVGSPTLSREWYLPEGSTRQPFTEEVAILNPGDRGARLAVTFMKVDGTTIAREFAMNPTSRLTLRVNDLAPEAEVSTRVLSDVPIAVERSMYFANGLGGTGSFGIPR
ncbi:MAG: peptidoglycan recognition protein family protein, partial [Chloroflexota bacterium]